MVEQRSERAAPAHLLAILPFEGVEAYANHRQHLELDGETLGGRLVAVCSLVAATHAEALRGQPAERAGERRSHARELQHLLRHRSLAVSSRLGSGRNLLSTVILPSTATLKYSSSMSSEICLAD